MIRIIICISSQITKTLRILSTVISINLYKYYVSYNLLHYQTAMLGLINLLRPVLWKRFYFFFLPTITIYFLLIIFLGDRLNIYDSDIYYLNWLDELREVAFDSNFLKNIAIATNSTLAAPEIIAVFPYWFLSYYLTVTIL